MSKQIPRRKAESQLFYPMMLKEMTVEDTKEYHLKKLEKLSKDLQFLVPQLQEPTYEQKRLVKRRLKASRNTWEIWNQ